jgi:signal transduction histidine kinase
MAARGRSDVFERWTPVWHAFYYAMIVIATGLVLSSWASERHAGPRALVLALVASLAAWHWTMLVRLGRAQREHPIRVVVFLAGAALASAGLLTIEPVFLMVAMALYNQVFAFLVMRWAVPVAIALTAVIGATLTRTQGIGTTVAVTVGAASAMLFAHFLSASAEESRKRRELIEELESTRKELALAERLAGMTEERHRMARELHDTVTQQLIGIVMHLDAASGSPPANAGSAADPIGVALDLARDGLAEARRLVWAERPRQLETGSLTRALSDAVGELRGGGGVIVEESVGVELDALPVAHQTVVLRGVREALANVRKHARAKRVTLTATADDRLLMVDVNDDGQGFDVANASPRARERARALGGAGYGLAALRDRVESLGGTLSVESVRGTGTTVAFHLPLDAQVG